jgi:hypothetical protein
MTSELESLFVVMRVAACVPVINRLLPVAVPQVGLLLAGGVLLGPRCPQMLDGLTDPTWSWSPTSDWDSSSSWPATSFHRCWYVSGQVVSP